MTKQEMIEKANKSIARGSKLSFEQIIAMYEKQEATQSKRDKRFVKRSADRELRNSIVIDTTNSDIYEINRRNMMKNLPSSLR